MKRSRFTEEQIIGASKRQETVEKTAHICRELGIHQSTFYKWKSKFGGMDVSESRKLRALEEGYSKLKKLVAELNLD